jgi:rare lipoprotein A
MTTTLKYLLALTLVVVNLTATRVLANTETTMLTSWYGPGLQGNRMANGDIFDMNDPTVAAHKELPFGTELELRNPENGREIVVTIQDRGPFVGERELDVSRAVAQRLGMIEDGVVELEVTILTE